MSAPVRVWPAIKMAYFVARDPCEVWGEWIGKRYLVAVNAAFEHVSARWFSAELVDCIMSEGYAIFTGGSVSEALGRFSVIVITGVGRRDCRWNGNGSRS